MTFATQAVGAATTLIDEGEPFRGDRDGTHPVLEVVVVTKTYPSEPPIQALRGVSFTVNEGELLAIVGPSGSGKSAR